MLSCSYIPFYRTLVVIVVSRESSQPSKIKVYSFHYFAQCSALCRNWYAWPRHPEQLIFQQCVSAHTFHKAKEKEAKVLSSQLHICASQMDSGWRFLHLDLLLRSYDKPGALQKRSTVWQKIIQHMSLSLNKLFYDENVNQFPVWLDQPQVAPTASFQPTFSPFQTYNHRRKTPSGAHFVTLNAFSSKKLII